MDATRLTHILIATLLLSLATVAPSFAQSDETVLWDIRGADDARRDAFRDGVREALAAAARAHLLSEAEFSAHITASAAEVPPCLRGVEDCVAPGALVFDLLDLSSFVQVELVAEGANFDVVDARGHSVRDGQVVERDARKLGFGVVREIFDATGVVAIDSHPRGATVELNGTAVGTTPLTYRVAVGEHTYALRMPQRAVVDGTFTVSSDAAVKVEHDLAFTAGQLVVLNAPDGASVYVDGELLGPATDTHELPPGNYEVEVRASGFAPARELVTVEPGLTVTRSIPMSASSIFARDVSTADIIFNNYILRLGLEGGLQRATFQDARSGDDIPYEFISFADDNGNLPRRGVAPAHQLGTFGLRLDLSYGLRNFGIVALSLSYLSRKANYPGFVAQQGDDPQPVTITAVRRLQVRPLQIFYRLFFNRFVPFAEAGIGINFVWLNAEGAPFEGAKVLRRTDALWTLGLGGQYYFTNNLFGVLRYSFQDYFERGVGTDHQLMLGFGTAFPNLFGFDPEPPEQL